MRGGEPRFIFVVLLLAIAGHLMAIFFFVQCERGGVVAMFEFQPILTLILKIFLLLTAVSLLGILLLKRIELKVVDFLEGMAFGTFAVVFFSYAIYRIAFLAGLSLSFDISMKATIFSAAIVSIFNCEKFARSLHVKGDFWVSMGKGLSAMLLLTAVSGFTVLSPFVFDSSIRFFGGWGQDAFGYIRVAQSILEGWYSYHLPFWNLDDVLFRPDRGWTYTMMYYRERPLAYFAISVLSSILKINVSQAYLVSGTIAFAFVSGFFITISLKNGLKLGFSSIIAFLCALSTGIIQLFYHQFLGLMWAIVFLLMLNPIVIMQMFPRDRVFNWKLLFSVVFVYCFLVASGYDVRFALLSIPGTALLLWRKYQGAEKIGIVCFALTIIVSSLLGGVAALYQGYSIQWMIGQLLGELKYSTSMSMWTQIIKLIESGYARLNDGFIITTIGVVAIFSFIIVGKKQLIKRSLAEKHEQDAMLYYLILLPICLAIMLFYSCVLNSWVAEKFLYLGLSILAVIVVGAVNSILKMQCKRWMKVSLLAILSIYWFISLLGTINMGYTVSRDNHLYVLRHDDINYLKSALEQKPDLIYFNSLHSDYLMLISCLINNDDIIKLAPYSEWVHGGGIFVRERYREYSSPLDLSTKSPEELYRLIIANISSHRINKSIVIVNSAGNQQPNNSRFLVQSSSIGFELVNNPNGNEFSDGKPFFWLGRGETEIMVFSAVAREAILQFDVSLGPSLPVTEPRRLHVSSTLSSEREFVVAKNGLITYETKLQAGINRIALWVLDRPDLNLLPNGDSRPLLLRMENVRVQVRPSHEIVVN
jgi:hypothetical protein